MLYITSYKYPYKYYVYLCTQARVSFTCTIYHRFLMILRDCQCQWKLQGRDNYIYILRQPDSCYVLEFHVKTPHTFSILGEAVVNPPARVYLMSTASIINLHSRVAIEKQEPWIPEILSRSFPASFAYYKNQTHELYRTCGKIKKKKKREGVSNISSAV